MTFSLFLAIVPDTPAWSPKIAIVMILCNVLAIAIGRLTIQQPSVGPQLPSPALFGGLSLGALIGSTALGHIIGTGVILGLTNLGAL
ncbi:MAG: photosystem I reaction center subunit PsaK [Kaiparowitsia implicata GSE-PSE-MK54-09C]|nr:photosystem I reaction center subunit PsaK [Kaiparowitsia implicata GSE-PSE-MK54-09C]